MAMVETEHSGPGAVAPNKSALAVAAWRFVRANPVILAGLCVVAFFVLVALLAPVLLVDPVRLNPLQRLRPPSLDHLFGTDQVGRSTFSRTMNGAAISLTVGALVMAVTVVVGLLVGLVTGYVRWLDGIVMRVMDGIMAIPGILLAIALMSLFGSSVTNVVIAISVAETPRMVRIVRASVLVVREHAYVEAATASAVRLPRMLFVHILPNAAAPIIVQATYVFASAMIVESILSFLGAGTPPTIPSWGNMLAEARPFMQRAPWMIAFPGIALALLVLTVNVLGDALRDSIDPRLARKLRS
ncbi:ABC transporter permease [Bosea sp. NPDC055332]